MGIKETIQNLFRGSTRNEQDHIPEEPVSVSVQFFDLQEESAAEEKGVEPGYYLSVQPILKPELQDPELMPKLSHFFFARLDEAGLLEDSGTRIAIDTKGEKFIDPARSWFFSPAVYIGSIQTLIVRADQIDRDYAQRMLVTALR